MGSLMFYTEQNVDVDFIAACKKTAPGAFPSLRPHWKVWALYEGLKLFSTSGDLLIHQTISGSLPNIPRGRHTGDKLRLFENMAQVAKPFILPINENHFPSPLGPKHNRSHPPIAGSLGGPVNKPGGPLFEQTWLPPPYDIQRSLEKSTASGSRNRG